MRHAAPPSLAHAAPAGRFTLAQSNFYFLPLPFRYTVKVADFGTSRMLLDMSKSDADEESDAGMVCAACSSRALTRQRCATCRAALLLFSPSCLLPAFHCSTLTRVRASRAELLAFPSLAADNRKRPRAHTSLAHCCLSVLFAPGVSLTTRVTLVSRLPLPHQHQAHEQQPAKQRWRSNF